MSPQRTLNCDLHTRLPLKEPPRTAVATISTRIMRLWLSAAKNTSTCHNSYIWNMNSSLMVFTLTPFKMLVSNKGRHMTTALYSTGLHPHVQPDFLGFLFDHRVGLISRCQFNLITNSSPSRPPSESCREALQVWCRVCVHISSFILAQLQRSEPANFLALWLSLK